VAHTVVLHIGAMKSGTTFVQQTLDAHREQLAAQGFLFPGKAWRQQVLGVMDVLEQTRDGEPVPGSVGAWPRLVQEIGEWDGAALISMEFLGPTPVKDIERVVGSLAPARVHAVMTVRDLGRNIPAMWQEGLKNGTPWSWREYLDVVSDGPGQDWRAKKFWRQMNYPNIARKWSQVVGPEQFTLVTVPQPGAPRGLLWERFCSVVGLDPAPFDTTVRSNASLGAASAQMLRDLNAALEGEVSSAQYRRVVKHQLSRLHLGTLAGGEPRIGFDDDWVTERAEAQIRRLRKLGLRVVGDLDELRPVPQEGVDPAEVPAEQQLEAAISALAYLVRVWPTP
jgi:hypothetical protein